LGGDEAAGRSPWGIRRGRGRGEALGDRAPAVVFPDGSEASYWHRRRSGDWARYVVDEVIPAAVRRAHADPSRVAIGGISMGGFGGFDIARLHPRRFCAVGGHSAALWLRGGDTAPGAFDDAADFARNDVIGIARTRGRAAWGRAALWLDGGTADPSGRVERPWHTRSRSPSTTGRAGTTGATGRPITPPTCASTPARSGAAGDQLIPRAVLTSSSRCAESAWSWAAR
jgi:S-formylglutathione hydrolase FrmB